VRNGGQHAGRVGVRRPDSSLRLDRARARGDTARNASASAVPAAPPFQPPPFQPPPFQSAPPYGSGSYSAPFPGGPFTVYPAPQASNGLAVAALIVSLCGFFCVGFAGLAAIGLGTAGYRQSLRSGVGRGMSIAAISIGIFWVLATIMLAAVLMAARRQ
jgi:hypothetical protein